MKKQLLICLVSALIMGSSAFYVLREPATGTFKLEDSGTESKSGISKAQSAKEAMQWRLDRLKDENGNFDPSYYGNAVKQADEMRQRGSRSGLGLQWQELGPDNVGGRTRAILIDRRDPTNNTVYAGGVSGGMWKSTDGAQTWTRLATWNQWLAVSCIIQGRDNRIWIGTGEGLSSDLAGSSLGSGSIGDGIFTLDGNDNPVQMTPEAYPSGNLTNSSPWSAVNRIAINPTDPTQIIAATNSGLWQLNPGGTWTQIQLPGISQGQSSCDVKWANNGTVIYATVNGNGTLVMSPNAGFSWSVVNHAHNTGFPPSEGRIEIAIAPTNSDAVYISVAAGAPYGATYGVFKTDSGSVPTASWKAIGLKGPLFDPFTSENQGWYDNTIAVNAFNEDKVYMGGVNLYTYSSLVGWNLADAGLGGGETNPYYIHPDKHTIVVAENDSNLMYVGCDGGIYKTTDAAQDFPFPNFMVKNRGYNVTQNYGIAAALTGEVIGGSQDNGTNYINYLGNTPMAADEVIGGDGIFTAVSHIDQRFYFGGVYYAALYRSGNTTASFSGFYDLKADPISQGSISACGASTAAGNAPFITPFFLGETKNAANGLITTTYVADAAHNVGDVVTAQSKTAGYSFQTTLTQMVNAGDTIQVSDPVRSRIFITSNCGVWMTSDALNLAIIPRWFKLSSTISGQAESYAGTADGDILYVGTNSGTVYRFNHLNALADTISYLPGVTASVLYPNTTNYTSKNVGGIIEGLAVDPADNNHVVATRAGFSASNVPHVYESHDGGQTWAPDTGGLPNMPVYTAVIHGSNIIVGTELGVWSWDGSQWHEENNLPFTRVPAYRMEETNLYTDGCPVIYLGTHGRGMWRTTTLTPSGCQTAVATGVNNIKPVQVSDLNIFPNPVQTTSKVSLTLDKTAVVTLRIFDMAGRLYKEVVYKNTIAGQNLFNLDGAGLSTGTYLLSATADDRTQSRLFVVAK